MHSKGNSPSLDNTSTNMSTVGTGINRQQSQSTIAASGGQSSNNIKKNLLTNADNSHRPNQSVTLPRQQVDNAPNDHTLSQLIHSTSTQHIPSNRYNQAVDNSSNSYSYQSKIYSNNKKYGSDNIQLFPFSQPLLQINNKEGEAISKTPWLDKRQCLKESIKFDNSDMSSKWNEISNEAISNYLKCFGRKDNGSTPYAISHAFDCQSHENENENAFTKDDCNFDQEYENDSIQCDQEFENDSKHCSSMNDETASNFNDLGSESDNELVFTDSMHTRPIEYNTFDIIKDAVEFYKDLLAKFNSKNNIKNSFSNDSPYDMCEAIKKINYFNSLHNLNEKTIKDLFVLLSDILPNVNWPILKSKNCNNVQLKIDDYILEDYRTIDFDICPNFCIAYVGDYKKLFSCPQCDTYRYSTCKRCKALASCNHTNDRTPLQRVWYRPLILLMYDLLETENFINAINYECETDKKYFRSDIRTGENYKKHYKDMTKKFNDKNNQDLIMVNLLISEFYDGIQLFKTKVQNFWPLMISILNLPLSMRIKSGVGTFMISLYTGKLNKPTEKFVLEECLVEELKQFYDGIEIFKNGKTYFVQIRLISTILDTKGFEETMHVQGTGSYAGCFLCNIGRGFQLGGQSKHVPILGHRAVLEKEHVLRMIGQSQNCCPENYYKKNNESNYKVDKGISDTDEDSNSESDDDLNTNVSSVDNNICKEVKCLKFDSLKSINDYKNKLTCLKLSDSKLAEFMKYMRGESEIKEWIWYHGYSKRKFNYKNFLDALWYPHCDYRNQINYTRRTTKSYYDDYKNFLELKKTKKTTKHYNGVKGVWHLHRLQYANIETDLCWDPFHTFFNVAKNILKNWKDERYDQYNIPFCKENELHYYLYDNDENSNPRKKRKLSSFAPWLIDEKSQTWIETIIYEILIPSGLSNDFQFRDTRMFKQTGNLRSTAYIQIITVLMKLILTVVSKSQKNSDYSMPKEYKLFYLMLSEDLNMLMSPVFHSLEEVQDIIKKLLEISCLSEGLFPPSENRLIQHQLYCMAPYILTAGSIKNFWAAPGERMLKSIKDCVGYGGMSFDLTAIKKFSKKENSIMQFEYSSNGEFFNNNNRHFIYNNNNLKVDYYSTYVFIDDKYREESITFNDSMESFLYVLILQIKKINSNYNDAYQKSILFRFFQYYLTDYKHVTLCQCIETIVSKNENKFHNFAVNLYKYLNYNNKIKYNLAMIYGTKFPSTGFSILNKIPFKNEIQNDYLNDYLSNEWNSKLSYSCWFKCKDFYNERKIKSNDSDSFGIKSWFKQKQNKNEIVDESSLNRKFMYGQFHYFMKVTEDFPDSNLHDLCLGCATLRETINSNDIDTFIDLIEIDKNTKKSPSNDLHTFKYRDFYFVDLNDVVPTRIMTVGVDEDFKAIKNRQDHIEDMELYYSRNNILKYILFIEMDEQRKGIMKSAKFDF